MSKKFIIGVVIFCVICLIVALCSRCTGEKIASVIVGFDDKCDYCGKDMEIKDGGKEYCITCFFEHDGNMWN